MKRMMVPASIAMHAINIINVYKSNWRFAVDTGVVEISLGCCPIGSKLGCDIVALLNNFLHGFRDQSSRRAI